MTLYECLPISRRGFTLIEVVIGVAIFLVVALGVHEAYRGLFKSLGNAREKTMAAALLTEKFEKMRSLPYESVISQTEVLVRGGNDWQATTTVTSIDDPFDGLAPADAKPADYKLVEVVIRCMACKSSSPVALSGRFAPQALEP